MATRPVIINFVFGSANYLGEDWATYISASEHGGLVSVSLFLC